MRIAKFFKVLLPILVLALWSTSATPSRAQGLPVFDGVGDSLQLQKLMASIQTLEKEIEENAAVQQVLTLNRYATQLQQSMTNAIGSVNSIAGTLKQYASGILGTINSAQNFKIQDLIPFFDPNSLSSFQAFTQLKNSMGGLMNNTTSLAGLQSGSQYQWSTLNTYYNRNIINTTLTSAQALNQQQAEIGDERLHIPTLDNLLKLGQSTADMTARNAGLTATAAYQIMSDNTQQALLDQAREEAAARSKRAAIASSLLQ